jgi:hypothetical protein
MIGSLLLLTGEPMLSSCVPEEVVLTVIEGAVTGARPSCLVLMESGIITQ